MEILGLIDLPLSVILIPFVALLIYMYGKWPGNIWKNLGVPSPPSTAFVGHVNKLFDPDQGMCKNLAKWTTEYGKIFGVLFFRKPVLVVTDLDALKEIFIKDFNNYTDHYITGRDSLLQPAMEKSIFFSQGQDWKRIRHIMSPTFSSGKLKLLTHYINKTAKQLVSTLQEHATSGQQLEAKPIYSAFSLDVLAGTAFGIQLDSQKNPENSFFQRAKQMTNVKRTAQLLMGAAEIFPFMGRFLKMFKLGFISNDTLQFFEEQLTELISQRKANPEQIDFLQLLINAEADCEDTIHGSKKLTMEEIIAQGVIFIYAGYESSSTTLQWLSYELAKNHDIQHKLLQEIEDVVGDEEEVGYDHCQKLKYMEAVLYETLRMYPPLHMLTRLVKNASTVKGIPVPSDAAIIIPVYNIGRDPELFEDPDTFNPERFMDNSLVNPISFLPFGFGPRQCIGMRLAMIQLKIALVHLIKAISIVEATPKKVDIEDFTGFLVPKEPIRLILTHREESL